MRRSNFHAISFPLSRTKLPSRPPDPLHSTPTYQAATLALGAAEERVLPNDDPESEQIYRLATMITATCSFDHRVVDGAVGAQWLAAYKKLIESPITMLL